MKKLVTILVLVACVNYGYSQADSVYKYVYIFRPDVPFKKPFVTIDSEFCKNGEPRVAIKIKNSFERHIWPSTISLKFEGKNIWCTSVTSGKFDTSLSPGSYALEISEINYFSAEARFSISGKENLYFKFHLSEVRFPQFYDIYSKVELNEKKIRKIKKCVSGKNHWHGCEEKKMYFILGQI